MDPEDIKEDIRRTDDGLLVTGSEGESIAGFYHGDPPDIVDDGDYKVWCPKCVEEAPEPSREYPINPLVYRETVHEYNINSDENSEIREIEKDLSGVNCSVCNEELPVEPDDE